MRRHLTLPILVFLFAVNCSADALGQIPQPTEPVVFCGQQAPPEATTYQVVIDGGAPTTLTMDATKDPSCAATDTHSFRLPATPFTVGSHTVQVIATNAFGSTSGPVYTVTVGIAPGPFTITGVKSK